MKITSLTILLGIAIFALAGCGGAANSNSNATSNANKTAGNIANAIMNGATPNANASNSNANASNTMGGMTAPKEFMNEAAMGGMAEVALANLAMKKSQDKEVKDFAAKMITDHGKANTELKELAAKKTVTLPTDVGAEHKATMEKLEKLSGAEFDKEYVAAMVKDHEKDVSLFKTQSESGTDADAKAFAAKTLPTLQMHLTMIKDIQGKMK